MLVHGGIYQKVVMQGTVASTGVVTGVSATGNGTAIECTRNGEGAYTVLTMQIKGITTVTVTFEATIDGTNWVAVGATTCADGTTVATTATADGLYRVIVAGFMQVRARISSWTTGATTITGVLTA